MSQVFKTMRNFYLFFLILTLVHLSQGVNKFVETNAELNETYTKIINHNYTELFQYDFSNKTIGDIKSANLRIEVEVHNNEAMEDCPVLVAIQKGREIISWELPVVLEADSGDSDRITYKYGGRTLCIDPTAKLFPTVNAIFSTCSENNISFSAVLNLEHDLIKKLWEEVEMYVSPTTPRYYRFDFPADIDTVIIKVSSDTFDCMILSIQKPKCPIFDLESNIQYTGYWQTVTYKTGVTVEKKDFPSGFIIVFSVSSKDEGCRNRDGYQSSGRSAVERDQKNTGIPRDKFVSFVIERALHPNEYIWPTFLPLVGYIPFLIVTVIIFYVSHNTIIIYSKDRSVEKLNSSCCMKSGKFMRKDIDEVDNYKLKGLQDKSTKYLTVMITIAVFYCIPVFQLIVSYLNVIYRTGEHDVCYYNNLCSHPLNSIMDFNHIYSNIGYVILGPIFMVFVKLRQRTVVYSLRNGGKPVGFGLKQVVRDLEHGTYQHYGLFYSLGFALFMEGFLSAGYHICPNRSNFQFDTSFMYAMAMLSYIKLYQFRHPLHMSESLTFITLGAVATCVVFGLLTESTPFNIVVSVLHVIIVIVVQIYLAFDTRERYEKPSKPLTKLIGVCKELCLQGDSTYLGKNHPNIVLFWWTVIANIFLMAFTWVFLRGNNFATQVLYVLLFNLAMYVLYYGIMKSLHGEWFCRESIQPAIYGIFALVFWIPGLYLFMKPLSGWEDSPSESRSNNDECILAKFYDNHDVWHLLSAGGLFYSFMFFLTIDDYHIGTHHTKIPMF